MVLPVWGFLLSRAHGVPDYSRTRLPPCGRLQPGDGRGGPGVLRSGSRLRLAVPSLVHTHLGEFHLGGVHSGALRVTTELRISHRRVVAVVCNRTASTYST